MTRFKKFNMPTNYSELVDQVIYNGFFSEYLPKVFSIKDLMNFTCLPSNKDDFVEPYSFNMSRFSEDEKRRIIYIPELASYIKCMKYIKYNNIIAQLIEESSKDRNSFSPIISHNGRLTRHEVFYNSLGLEPFRDDEVNSTYMDNMIKK